MTPPRAKANQFLSSTEILDIKLILNLIAYEGLIEDWEIETLLGWKREDVRLAYEEFKQHACFTPKTLSIIVTCLNNVSRGPQVYTDELLMHHPFEIEQIKSLCSRLHRLWKSGQIFKES